jgi:hypothetical protein
VRVKHAPRGTAAAEAVERLRNRPAKKAKKPKKGEKKSGTVS